MRNKEWRKMELSHILEISKSKFNPKTTNENKKCIELEHISQETGKLLGYTNSNEQQSIKNIFKKNQVLFGKLRPYLKKYWKADFEGVCSTEIWVLNGKSVTNDYLLQFIQTNKFNQIANVSSGSKMPRADWKYMAEIPFDVPPLKEQQKIAKILTTWDETISKQEALIGEKEQLKKGLMQKLLSGEVRFKEFDEEWEEVRFNNIFERVTRKNTINNTNVLTISAQHGLINQEDFFNKSIASKDLSGYILLKKGEFAYNKSYSSGYPMGAFKRLNLYDEGVLSSLYIYFRIKDDNSDFYEQYFEAGLMNKEIFKIAQEGARNHGLLNMSVKEFFNDMLIIKPPLQEQQKIAQVLTTADREIELLKKELETLKEQKRGLMQKLLMGEVRVEIDEGDTK